MASQKSTSAWSGGRVSTLGAEREKKKRKKPPSTAGDRQAIPTVCAKIPPPWGGLRCEPAPGSAEKGLVHPRGIAQRGKSPLFLPVGRRNKRVWWVSRTNDRARSAQRSSVHACSAGGWWVPWPLPPRARDALSAHYWGTRHHEVEKRGARWCSGEHMATGFVGASSVKGGREGTFRCRISTNGLPPGRAWLARGLIHLIHLIHLVDTLNVVLSQNLGLSC